MAIVQFLGLMDFLAAVSLILLRFDVGQGLAYFFGIWLLIKGIIFIKSFAGVLDLICAIIILFAAYGYLNILTILAILWLLQKSIFSFL